VLCDFDNFGAPALYYIWGQHLLAFLPHMMLIPENVVFNICTVFNLIHRSKVFF